MKYILFLFFTGLATFLANEAVAQSSTSTLATKLPEGVIQREAKFKMSVDSTASFTYYEVRDTLGLRNFAKKAKQGSFPLIVLKKPVFDPFFDLVLNLESELDACHLLQRHYMALDTVHQQKIAQLNALDSIQNKRIDNFRNLSEDLRKSNIELSKQVTMALETAKTCENKKVKGKIWFAILGGAVGFSVAGLIALVK